MHAMTLRASGLPLVLDEHPDPEPGQGQVRRLVLACAVCRADVHIADGTLPTPRMPLVPGHEVVGMVEAAHPSVTHLQVGQRVGLTWMGSVCGRCAYCISGRENLCEGAHYTGFHVDGGFATHVVADAQFCFPLDQLEMSAVDMAPLLCGGITGWRALKLVGDVRSIGLFGFGASAQFVAQVAHQQGRRVYVFTKPGDTEMQAHALKRGAHWAGGSDEPPPHPLDGCIVFAPAGELLPISLRQVRRGGRVVSASLHMADVPSFPFDLLTHERQLLTASNFTRRDAHEFIALARHFRLAVDTTMYRLEQANEAIASLRQDTVQGTPVLVP